MFIAKNRNGPDGIIYDIFMDTSNVCIKMLPKVSVNTANATLPMNPVPVTAKEQRGILQNRYEKFKTKRR